MKINLPTNDDDRLSLLHGIMKQAKIDDDAGNRWLSRWRQKEVTAFANSYSEALWSTRRIVRAQRLQRERVEEAASELQKPIQAIWQDLRWKLRWEDLDAQVLEYYSLDHKGRQPNVSTRNDWINLGQKMVIGFGMAHSKGLPTVKGQKALAASLAVAEAENDTLVQSGYALSDARDNLIKLRQKYNRFYSQIISELRYAIADESKSRQLGILRAYSVPFQLTAADLARGRRQTQPANTDEALHEVTLPAVERSSEPADMLPAAEHRSAQTSIPMPEVDQESTEMGEASFLPAGVTEVRPHSNGQGVPQSAAT